MLQRTHSSTSFAAPQNLYREFVIVFGASLVIAMLAQLSIPLQPVPFSGQTLGVFLIGAS